MPSLFPEDVAAAAAPKRGRGRPRKIQVTLPSVTESPYDPPAEGGGVQMEENSPAAAAEMQVDFIEDADNEGWVTVIRKKKRKPQFGASSWTKEQRHNFRHEGDMYKMSVADFIEPVQNVAPHQQGPPNPAPVVPPAPPPVPPDQGNIGGGLHPPHFNDDDDFDDDDDAGAAGGHFDPEPGGPQFDPEEGPLEEEEERDDDEEFHSVDEDEEEPSPRAAVTPKRGRKTVSFGPVFERRRRAAPSTPRLTREEAEFISRVTGESPGRSPRGGRSTRSSGQTLSPSVLSKYYDERKRKK